MKIAFLSRYQNSVNRGAESFVTELSSRLSSEHQVDILSGKDADSLTKVLKGKYDVVIPMNGRMQSFKVSIGRLIGGYKLVITGQSGVGRDDIFNIAICMPNVFVCITDYMFQWAQKWVIRSKLVKIPNGVDLEKFRPYGEKLEVDLAQPIILSVGALEWYKFHERTIEALSLLEKGSLLIVGKGSQRKALQNLGNKKLVNRFKIMEVSYMDMPKVYRSADLFVLPSWEREAFGIVYLEAMASGLGVVAPNDLPRQEIIGKAGILTEVSDPHQYANDIQKALDQNWTERSVNQAVKFSWDVIAQRYDQILKEICHV